MGTHRETELKINFEKGHEIDVTVVNDGDQVDSRIFHKSTHSVEEVIDFINSRSYENEVYF